MGVYYVHKATRGRKVPYSFQCEHCMADSGQLIAEITATVEENSHYRTLKSDKQEKLNNQASKKLGEVANITYKDVTEKQLFSEAFKDECPHCHKTQSWRIASVADDARSTLFAILVVGIVICAGVYFTQDQDLLLTFGIAGAFAVAAIGYSIFKAVSLMNRKRVANSAMQKNLPKIDWTPIQDLLDSAKV